MFAAGAVLCGAVGRTLEAMTMRMFRLRRAQPLAVMTRFALGVVLLASSLPFARTASAVTGTPTGFHDGFEGIVGAGNCAAEGWAVDPDDPYRDLSIRILADGAPVAAGTADLFRQDLVDAGVSPDGTSGFHVGLWGLVSTDVAHAITAQALDEETAIWVDLADTPRELTCLGQRFTGVWEATDMDGSALVMIIGRGDAPRVFLVDSYATACANANLPTRLVGVGKGAYSDIFLFVEPLRTWCGRFPLGEANLQFYHDPGSDTLWEDEDGDGAGITWYRAL